MAAIKKGDFVELEYTGIVKDNKFIFDTTDKAVAKDAELSMQNTEYGPVVVCIGEKQLVKGLDIELEGKETGKSYEIELKPENAFGKKNPKLVQLISTGKFTKENIRPVPGLQVNIDGILGVVKNVSGGRTLVDFNHPLAGLDIVYKVKANKIVTSDEEKVRALLRLKLQVKDIEVIIKEGVAELKLKQKIKIPDPIVEQISDYVRKIIPSVKAVKFNQ